MEPFIVCENLVKIYMIEDEEVLALQGLDLIVGRGEFMAIVGASGSGKSTLLNVLGGLDLPTAGRATVGGRNLLRMSQSDVVSGLLEVVHKLPNSLRVVAEPARLTTKSFPSIMVP